MNTAPPSRNRPRGSPSKKGLRDLYLKVRNYLHTVWAKSRQSTNLGFTWQASLFTVFCVKFPHFIFIWGSIVPALNTEQTHSSGWREGGDEEEKGASFSPRQSFSIIESFHNLTWWWLRSNTRFLFLNNRWTSEQRRGSRAGKLLRGCSAPRGVGDSSEPSEWQLNVQTRPSGSSFNLLLSLKTQAVQASRSRLRCFSNLLLLTHSVQFIVVIERASMQDVGRVWV